MAPIKCGEVRLYLAGVQSGRPGPISSEGWELLATRGAVSGSSSAPELTPVGKHVLSELQVRTVRTDPMGLDEFATQLDRVSTDLDNVAKNAEYFLADLGAIATPDAIPRLRPLAVGLANRRETPEELAREFREIWGGVEVMGGNAADRLVAAELLHAARAKMEAIYSPMMTTSATVREIAGPRAPAVTVAAILQLHPNPDGKARLAEYQTLRKTASSEEGAAMLAATGRDIPALLALREQCTSLITGGTPPSEDQRVAGGFLAVLGASPDTAVPRLQATAKALAQHVPFPYTLGAVLSNLVQLEPSELIDWVGKAREIAHRRNLAPTVGELTVLGISLVAGLPLAEFGAPEAERPRLHATATLVALNTWAYSRLLSPPAAPA